MCQCISPSVITNEPVWWGIVIIGGYAWVETEDLWEISVPFLKFPVNYGALKVVLNFLNGLTRTTAVQNAGKPQFSYSAGRNVNHQGSLESSLVVLLK